MKNEYTLSAEMLTESPTYRRHSLPSPYKALVDSEDEEAALHRLVGEDDDHNTHVFHHEVKAGSSARPTAALGSTVPHSLPDNGLIKAISTGSLQRLGLTQLDRSDRLGMSSLPNLGAMDDIRGDSKSQPRAIKRTSSTRIAEALISTPGLRLLSKKLLTPIDTQKQELRSAPESPSPLRKACLPGDDMTQETDLEEKV